MSQHDQPIRYGSLHHIFFADYPASIDYPTIIDEDELDEEEETDYYLDDDQEDW